MSGIAKGIGRALSRVAQATVGLVSACGQAVRWVIPKLGRLTWWTLRRVPRAIAWAATIAGLIFVGFELRENWRQAQLSYLQDRGQDFLAREYDSPESLSCLYDWWFESEGAVGDELLRAACEDVYGNVQTYSETKLYVEEVFMYFVEEARIGCKHDISYGHELDIWRNDIHEDRSGVFGYYLLYRFGDPRLGYLLDTRLPLGTSAERIAALVQQARLPEMSLSDICTNARRFRGALIFPVAEPEHVAEVCARPSESVIFVASGSEGARDRGYCREVHGVEQSLLNWSIFQLRNTDQSLGERYVPD